MTKKEVIGFHFPYEIPRAKYRVVMDHWKDLSEESTIRSFELEENYKLLPELHYDFDSALSYAMENLSKDPQFHNFGVLEIENPDLAYDDEEWLKPFTIVKRTPQYPNGERNEK